MKLYALGEEQSSYDEDPEYLLIVSKAKEKIADVTDFSLGHMDIKARLRQGRYSLLIQFHERRD